jgi:hypothetical protein
LFFQNLLSPQNTDNTFSIIKNPYLEEWSSLISNPSFKTLDLTYDLWFSKKTSLSSYGTKSIELKNFNPVAYIIWFLRKKSYLDLDFQKDLSARFLSINDSLKKRNSKTKVQNIGQLEKTLNKKKANPIYGNYLNGKPRSSSIITNKSIGQKTLDLQLQNVEGNALSSREKELEYIKTHL